LLVVLGNTFAMHGPMDVKFTTQMLFFFCAARRWLSVWPKHVTVDIATVDVVLIDCVSVLFGACLVATRKDKYLNKVSGLLYLELPAATRFMFSFTAELQGSSSPRI